MKGLYQIVRKTWKKPKENLGELFRDRLIKWRREPRFQRVDRPTRIDRARAIGYKAKQGYIVVRAKMKRGGKKRPFYGRRGRKPSKTGVSRIVRQKSQQWILEERAARKFLNLEVLGSYPVAKDGRYLWTEVVLVDKSHPSVVNDPKINWITEPQHTRRVFRGLTSSAKKSRGMRS